MQPTLNLKRAFVAVSAAAMCATAAAPLHAQDFSAERRGLAASFGVGATTAGVSCVPKCEADRRSGASFMFRGAANITPQITVAAEVNVFQRKVPISTGDGRWEFTWVTFGALWYPKAEEDIFLHAALGVAVMHVHATFPVVGPQNMNTSSLGLIVGVGRDFRIGNGYAITAYADYLSAARSTAFIANADSGARLSGDLVTAGLAITIF